MTESIDKENNHGLQRHLGKLYHLKIKTNMKKTSSLKVCCLRQLRKFGSGTVKYVGEIAFVDFAIPY